MTGFISKVKTTLALGLPNVMRVANYRLGVKFGLNPVRRLQAAVPAGPFFAQSHLGTLAICPSSGWQGSARLFSRWPFALGDAPPDWLANPLTGQRVAAPERNWWEIPDFDPAVGDIKLIWELSRLDWVLAFAQRARNGDKAALAQLNAWLADWCSNNPPYRGPNWKCGQEASIRVMHLAMAAILVGQMQHTLIGLRDLVHLHLRRIAPTIQYAVAQDNNHGTSEAAALFIGGSWLASLGVAEGVGWERLGRRWLEERAARLIGKQGSFSQYSLNYHRLMLDTYCMAEVWRKHLALPEFSARLKDRALAATQWLRHMVNPHNGDGPNIGANDGARLLQLTDAVYRDYRPSVQLGMALFCNERAYVADGPWNNVLRWLDVPVPSAIASDRACLVADDGGFAVLRRSGVATMMRYPRFRFRPSQADALHVDLWLDGDNLLRDAGSYSYNTEQKWMDYFSGTSSHNTVQFDNRDQMPKLSRFLFGSWLQTSTIEPLVEDAQGAQFGAGYLDRQKVSHHRQIRLCGTNLKVVDKVAGFKLKAVLRWRLAPGDWRLDGQVVTNGVHVLTVQASMPIVRFQLVEGWESRHYLEKTPLPVLEVEVLRAGTVTTDFRRAA